MNKKIVVLYKETGQAPVIKIIANMFEIKKMIVESNLDMVRYENCIIVCSSLNQNTNQVPNIVLDFKHITGDLFLIGYNPKIKDFRSLNKDEVKFYKDALDRKSFQYDKYKKWLEKCKFIAESSSNNKILVPKLNSELGDNEENKTTSSLQNEKMLEMILNIQAILLKYLKNNNESE
ncbi:MAG: hypothetical protein HFJ45_07185 [Clostridia bacterium]|nr:hypothetical protein [Clostridia bacterium]